MDNAAKLAIEKYEADVKRLTEALALNPKDSRAWDDLGDAYMGLDKAEEALNSYFKVIEIDPKNLQVVCAIALLYQGKGNRQEAKKYADMGYSLDPNHYKPNYVLTGLLLDEGKMAEAEKYNKVCLKLYPDHPETNFRMGNIYMALGNEEKARECWQNGCKGNYNSALSYCNRGQCYYKLGKKEEALADFKTAETKIHTADGFTPSQKEYTRKALQAILGAEAVSTQAEAELQKLTQSDSMPALKKFTARVQELQAKKKEVQDKVVHELNKADKETNKNVDDLERLKEEFNMQLAEMKQAMLKMENKMDNMDQRITNVEHGLVQMKEELDNKLDDFKKKLEKELDKQDLPAEDKTKIKGYFKAFLETFSSGYVTAQVVASGQVQLDAGSSATTILSTLASFAPFCGSALESGIKTVGEFLKSKEMITSARAMKGLAGDSSQLSQLVGRAGYDIALDKEQQNRILKVTDEELRKVSGDIFKKIRKFCDNLNETIDGYLYSKLYSLPAERLGHNDANLLIEKWINADIVPYEIEKQFIQEIKKQTRAGNDREIASVPSPEKVQKERSACCNIF